MFQQLVSYYLNEFSQKGEPALKTICNCKVPSEIILMEYKKLTPIENLPEKDKKELKLYVIDMFKGKTKEELVNCAKITYTIGTLL